MLSKTEITKLLLSGHLEPLLRVSDPKRRLDLAFTFVVQDAYVHGAGLLDPTREPKAGDYSAKAQAWYLLRSRTESVVSRFFS